MDESKGAYNEKKWIKYYFRSLNYDNKMQKSVSFNIKNYKTTPNNKIILPTGITHTLSEKESNYVKITIDWASSYDDIISFRQYIIRYFNYYNHNKVNIINMYTTLLPKSDHKMLTDIDSKLDTAGGRDVSQLDILKSTAPHIFGNFYTKQCQKGYPDIINPDDKDFIRKWKMEKFVSKGKEYNKQVLPFPSEEDPEWYFICKDEKYPFPGVFKNIYGHNKDDYEFLPCCYVDIMMADNLSNDYNKYYKNKIRTKEKGSGGSIRIRTTRTLLQLYREGEIGSGVNNLLKTYARYDDASAVGYTDYVRYGMPHTPNSILHCLAFATNDPNYMIPSKKVQTVGELERYVKSLRSQISKSFNPNIVKQENYDLNNDEIISIFSNTDMVLDPNRYFRILEEVFGVNIFVFRPTKDDSGEILIPRNRIFHARTIDYNRPTVLVYKYQGVGMDFPQCDLIILTHGKDDKLSKDLGIKMFGSEMTYTCHKALKAKQNQTIWYIDADNKIGPKFPFYNYNYRFIFGDSIFGQVIDEAGKCRALGIWIETSKRVKKQMIVFLPPVAPLDVPLFNPDDIPLLDIDDVISYFTTKPTYRTRKYLYSNGKVVNDKTIGLWYPIFDIKAGIYVPVLPSASYVNLDVGPSEPYKMGEGVVKNVRKLVRSVKILRQLYRWVYGIYLYSIFDVDRSNLSLYHTEITLNNFIKKYVRWIPNGDALINNDELLEDKYYKFNITTLSRTLPPFDRVEDAIEYLYKTNMVKDGYILIHSKTVFDELNKYIAMSNSLRYDFQHLNDYYLYPEDFIQTPNTKILAGVNNLNLWFNTREVTKSYNKYTTINKIGLEYMNNTSPFYYQDSDSGNIYMIQNTQIGDIDTALHICDNWRNFGVNLGYTTPPSDKQNFSYAIYSISIENKLEPIDIVESTTSNKPYHILRYPIIEDDTSNSTPAVAKITPKPVIKNRGRPKKAPQIIEVRKRSQTVRYAAILPISTGYNPI